MLSSVTCLALLWALQVQGQRVCSAHSTRSRRGPDVRKGSGRANPHSPTTTKKAAVLKPPLRFPAPGASPLHKIKQPGACFISPPAAHPPGGRSRLSRTRLLRCPGRGCGGTSPTGTLWPGFTPRPVVWGFPVCLLCVKQLGLLLHCFFPKLSGCLPSKLWLSCWLWEPCLHQGRT